ncbi:MAG: aldo/keto reductase [Chitinophagales bacterium]
MQYRRLGKSGLQVSTLSFGAWITFGKQIAEDVATDLMKTAYDGGINFFDNAEAYAAGEAERVMGRIFNKMQWDRSSFLVSSKVYFGDGGRKPNQTGLSRKHIMEACEAALKRLQVDYLDLFFCHRPDKNTPIEETVWAMNHLIQQGKILYWGTSEWSAQEITEAHAAAARYSLIGPTMEQPQYNMLHRERFEIEYGQLYKNFGMGTTIWSPLASGILTGKYNEGIPDEKTRLTMEGMEWLKDGTLVEKNLQKVRNLSAYADTLGISMPNLALAWCVKNPNVSTVILGASKVSHLEENLKTLDYVNQLTDEVMIKIDDILGNKPAKPMW